MKIKFSFTAGIILFSTLFISCSNLNVFNDINFGNDMESVESILKQKRIKYKTYEAAPFLDIDISDHEEIADAIENSQAGYLGDMLYKESFYFKHKILGIKFETFVFFFDDKSSNIKLEWHVKNDPSIRNGFLASEKLRAYICEQYSGKEFVQEESNFEKYVMQASDTVKITVEADIEFLDCIIEDSIIQKPFYELREEVNDICHYYHK